MVAFHVSSGVMLASCSWLMPSAVKASFPSSAATVSFFMEFFMPSMLAPACSRMNDHS